jgi:hypothetical protein
MGLEIETLRKAAEGAMYVSPARLCVTADDELCAEDDQRAVRLLVGKGGSIPAKDAARYGLIEDGSAETVLRVAAETISGEGAASSDGEASDAEGGETAAGAASGAPTDDQGPSLGRMRRGELLELAAERGIEVGEDVTVAQLRELLRETDAGE